MIRYRILSFAFVVNCLLFISCKGAGMPANDFATFLSELKEVSIPDISAFGSYESKNTDNKFSCFLPVAENDCPCKEINWKNGGYMLNGNIVVVFMSRICWDYHDAFDKYLMENTGRDLIMIAYSAEGKLIDYKIVAHEGEAYKVIMKYDVNNKALIVERGSLKDGKPLREYGDLTFNMERHIFSVDKNGMIKDAPTGKPWKEILRNNNDKAGRPAFSKFLIRFEKWKETDVDNSVFENNNNDNTLSTQDIYMMTSDTLDCDCFQKDLMWNAGHYINTGKSYYCFVVKCCEYPKDNDSDRYIDYLILEFDKNGVFVKSHELIRLPYDPSEEEMETGKVQLQETLKKKWKAITASE